MKNNKKFEIINQKITSDQDFYNQLKNIYEIINKTKERRDIVNKFSTTVFFYNIKYLRKKTLRSINYH